jgi:hypothetical protein
MVIRVKQSILNLILIKLIYLPEGQRRLLIDFGQMLPEKGKTKNDKSLTYSITNFPKNHTNIGNPPTNIG